jgi:hypothetical protein
MNGQKSAISSKLFAFNNLSFNLEKKKKKKPLSFKTRPPSGSYLGVVELPLVPEGVGRLLPIGVFLAFHHQFLVTSYIFDNLEPINRLNLQALKPSVHKSNCLYSPFSSSTIAEPSPHMTRPRTIRAKCIIVATKHKVDVDNIYRF